MRITTINGAVYVEVDGVLFSLWTLRVLAGSEHNLTLCKQGNEVVFCSSDPG